MSATELLFWVTLGQPCLSKDQSCTHPVDHKNVWIQTIYYIKENTQLFYTDNNYTTLQSRLLTMNVPWIILVSKTTIRNVYSIASLAVSNTLCVYGLPCLQGSQN